MALLTVELPKPVLDSLKRKARAGRRRVVDQLVETLTVALDQESPTPRDLEASLDGMQFLTDQELVKATKAAPARKITRELSALRDKCPARLIVSTDRDIVLAAFRSRRERTTLTADRTQKGPGPNSAVSESAKRCGQ